MRAMRSDRPTSNPAWGPPTSLSPLKQTRSAPDAQALHRRRLVRQPEGGRVEQRPGAQIVDDDRAELMGHLGKRGGFGLLDETLHPEVGRMDAQDGDRSAGFECLPVVGDPGAVRRTHLDQPQPGAPDDVRDAHAAADLDQLAAGDRDAPGAATAGWLSRPARSRPRPRPAPARRRRRCCW